ncbi:guanine nucleotide-binding protein g(o) subunit alpha [Anaeramoeba flamelloides]|uniref:Guanine nucleotide-binding protein g(O) subunit alpha n=1 Tax=Anaeramoeba flamelloides TaxID=1746091 RepID=A0AAV8ACF0_9EUKA|nr:guanine nucleotide-binding protein g(o) subunit alpha [Anaeramoeba flamelloides]KAJ6255608.1 guanine nucleotide-binding protein g(o) subunit alpha [Anaeramoeba flamelloides]
MGTCFSSESSEDRAANKQNKKINAKLKKLKNQIDEEIKILLLGAGESGKSTLFKQMKLLQDGNFDDEDYEHFITIIRQNTVSQMKVLIMAAEQMSIPIENSEIATMIKQFRNDGEDWTEEFTQNLKKLWMDSGIQQTFKKRDSNFHLNDSAEYFFENVDRIGETNFKPSKNDILHARVRTTGIDEADFSIEDFRFTMVDVGGQRNERRKWIHCFEDVTSVIFVASLCGYTQTLREDSSVNRMIESLNLFKEIWTSPWFSSSSIILFLNKKDMFEVKIKETDLSVCFEDYTGGNDFKKAVSFIKEKFEEASKSEEGEVDQDEDIVRELYSYETCAIDTKNVEVIFKMVSDYILKTIISESFEL